MRIIINGEGKDVPEGLNVRSLIAHLAIPGERVAVEYNRDVLSREHWEVTLLQPDDRLEIVHFVGGG